MAKILKVRVDHKLRWFLLCHRRAQVVPTRGRSTSRAQLNGTVTHWWASCWDPKRGEEVGVKTSTEGTHC